MKPRRLYIAVKDFTGEAKVGGEVKVPRGSLLSQEDARVAFPNGTFWAKVLDAEKVVRVPPSMARELSGAQSGLLEAVTNGDERLALFKQEWWMQKLSTLGKGDRVRVQITSASGQKVPGIIRYRGPIDKNNQDTSIIFGVELGSATGKGFTDGSFKGQKFFSCRENCGVFVPVSRIEPDRLVEGSPAAPQKGGIRKCTRVQLTTGDPLSSPELTVGDRVSFKMENSTPTGIVVYCNHLPGKFEAGVFVGIFLVSTCLVERISSSTPTSDEYEDSSSPSSIRYPPPMKECFSQNSPPLAPSSNLEELKEEIAQVFERKKKKSEAESEEDQDSREYDHHPLEINSMVEVYNPPIYGVIRWIGDLPDERDDWLEEPLPTGCTDGQYKGIRYFYCQPNKALFVKLSHCHPDSRFDTLQTPENPVLRCNSLDFRVYASAKVEEDTPPPPLGNQGLELLSGWKRGIQGHCNSCYLDATLFCMFSFTSVLDSMLLRPADKNDAESYTETRDLLRTEIVNPLRKNGYVCATKIMALRKVLETAGHSSGFTSEEKDPEEFLTLLFRVLKMEPLFHIRSAGQDPHGCIFYQIFTEDHPTHVVPTVQELLEGSLVIGDLKFTEAPSCLILQMPRNGKNFKLTCSPRECSLCQGLAVMECPDCYRDPSFGMRHIKQFCKICNQQVSLCQLSFPGYFLKLYLFDKEYITIPRQTMQLFAVLCIETSHYVGFTRHGPDVHQWLFFDSMADREGEFFQNAFSKENQGLLLTKLCLACKIGLIC
uniref:ubiquitinyl hydrolase 1 n=1 Tax=Naja naja TaxID=35670 RepID=A0A8C6XKJ8_NAJNA